MTEKLYTVRDHADKALTCCECRSALRAGEDAVARILDGFVEHAHIHCPTLAPMEHPERRVTQGAK